jgi:xanthine dehydrogenase YagR molybdenum-binding subunit
MKFETPATTNPIDQLKIVGKPVDRIDGRLKTTGTAPYAYERHDAVAKPAYGYVVGSAIAKGRIASFDLDRAKAAPGVLAIVTAENAGKLDKGNLNTARLLGGPEIQHYHQAVAVVVAENFEQARDAAQLVRVDYVRTDGAFDLSALLDAAKPQKITGGPGDSAVGDFAGAFSSAPVRLDATYTTPDEAHAMMEPHASMAAWEGDKLTLWTSNQMIAWNTADIAKTLGMPKENVRLISPFIGGGFGGKLFPRADALLAALGARAAGRPVKVALQRPLMFNNTTHRPATIQRIRIGTTKEGKITAIGHESWSGDLPGGKADGAVAPTRMLYAGANRMTATKLAVLDLAEGNAMRAPGEATGMMAFEIAMDEMAEKLGIDPIEFRILNDTQIVPDRSSPASSQDPQAHTSAQSDKQPDLPFSQRQLVECFRLGAERFGWAKRNAQPGQARDGRWLVGIGTAAAFRNNQLTKSAARVRLEKDGSVTVETDMTDIGTGTYTIIAQTAAEMMGVPIERVAVHLGDSTFPVSAGSGGQWGANNSTAGVYSACLKLREMIAQKLGFNSAEAQFVDGDVRAGNRGVPLSDAARDGSLSAEDGIEYGDLHKKYQQSTFGAHFVEVGVDAATAEVRVRRMLAVCAAGRILNPKTARSQVIGAMTMGVGAALMEDLIVDKRIGFYVNHDLAGYEVPVHADIPHQDMIFLEETDPMSSPMKAKGVAELGICGVAAAVANAIYNATGVRVRDYPITLDKLIDKLPAVG